MGQFLNSITEVRKNYNKYDEWEQVQADERAKKEYLAQKLEIPEDKLELTHKRAQAVVRATEIMDARSEDNCENMEQLTSMISAIPIFGLAMAQIPIINFADRKLTAKIKEKMKKIDAEVKGKNLADEQTKIKLKEYAKLSEKADKISKKVQTRGPFVLLGVMLASTIGMILWSTSKQKEASRIGRYQAKQNELKGLENFVVYTPEQMEKAKEIAKKYPDEKERNSISKIIKELKDVAKDKKAYEQWLSQKDPQEIEKLKALNENLSGEKLQHAQEDKEMIVDAVKEINIKAEEYSENLENAFDTLQTVSWLAAIPLGFGINKLLKAFKVSPKVNKIVSFAVPVMTSLGISMTGTVEQKTASRIGRYKARQDIMKNPARLMAYSDEDMKKAKNIKADKQKQGFFEKLGGSFSFIGKYFKDKSEYNKYKKTTQKENEKIQKAFKEIEVSEAQKLEAQNLQKNVFRAFDEIDEMSQRYSEDVEAGCDIAKEVGMTAWSIGSTLGIGLLAVSIAKGKFPITKLGNWLTNLTFEAKSPIKTAVNNLYSVVKQQDKVTVRKFHQALINGNLKSFLEYPQNKALKEAAEPLFEELGKIGNKGLADSVASGGKKDISKVFSELFAEHFKKTPLAKWTRSMISQSTKLWAKSKANKVGAEIPKEVQEQLGMNFNYKNYKTLINTGLVAGVPVLGVIIGIPYAFNAWLTSIQKKAGKIGIMKAMDKIDDPRVFVTENPVDITQPKPVEVLDKPIEENNSNLLKKFKN